MTEEMENKARAVIFALTRMFNEEPFFDICTVRKCMQITGAKGNTNFNTLTLYHCAYWKNLSQKAKEFIFNTTVENVFDVDNFPAIKLVGDPSKAALSEVLTKIRLE